MIIQAINGCVSIDVNKLFKEQKKEEATIDPNAVEEEVEFEEIPDSVIDNLIDGEDIDWDDVTDGSIWDDISTKINNNSKDNDSDNDSDDLDDAADSNDDAEPDRDNDNEKNNSSHDSRDDKEEEDNTTEEFDDEPETDGNGETEDNDSSKETESTVNEEETTDDTDDTEEAENKKGNSSEDTDDTDDDNTEEETDNNNGEETEEDDEDVNDEKLNSTDSKETEEDTNTNEEEIDETGKEIEEALNELDASMLAKLAAHIHEQEKFNDGNVDMTKVAKDKNNSIEALDEAGIELEVVGKTEGLSGISTIIIKKITNSLMDADPFGCFIDARALDYGRGKQNIENIAIGVRLGAMLGRKLQIRNEERNTTFTRLRTGKIDKRLISSIGYGAEQVFSQVLTDRYNPVLLRMSIDASGSMGGQKWNKTMTAVTAICKAASMVSNLDVVVDIRTTTFGSSIGDKPLIAIAYDSRVDKFEKIHRVFPRLRPVGTTPEGLCFEAILKTMVADKAKDQYFINFSDGEPYFETRNFSYHGYVAFRHTKKQVEILRDRGIKILSFFITEHETESLSYGFKEMYGADARNINVTNLLPLAKEINSMFV